jgi:hypothetical protein
MEERNILYSVPTGTTPPPAETTLTGTLWFDKNNGVLYILYDDGDSKQWVQASAPTYNPNP